MKKYLLYAAMCAGVVSGAYWAGGRAARAQCAAEIAELRIGRQLVNLELLGGVYEKSVNLGVRDIRRILRQEYTIAD